MTGYDSGAIGDASPGRQWTHGERRRVLVVLLALQSAVIALLGCALGATGDRFVLAAFITASPCLALTFRMYLADRRSRL